jgi:hypothetical protein
MIGMFVAVVLFFANAEIRTTEPLQAVLIAETGEATRAELPLDRDSAAGVRTAWIWTKSLPPIEVSPDDLTDLSVLRRLLESAPVETVVVEIKGRSKEELSGMALIAAPQAMWGSVPEPLLPRLKLDSKSKIPVPRRDGPLQVRLVGEEAGTAWIITSGATRELTLEPLVAKDLQVQFLNAEGDPVSGAFVTILGSGSGDELNTALAQFVSDDEGFVHIGSLPLSVNLRLMVNAPQHVPRVIEGTVQDFASRVLLSVGRGVKGRFADGEGKPIANVEVDAETWIDGSTALIRRSAKSDDSGAWAIPHLPAGRIAVRSRSERWSVWSREVTEGKADHDFGDIGLGLAIPLELLVSDSRNDPVSGAEVRVTGIGVFRSNSKGTAQLKGLRTDREVEILVRAEGYEQFRKLYPAPVPKRDHVELQRSALIEASLVDEDLQPVLDARVTVQQEHRYRVEEPRSDAELSIFVSPDTETSLTIEASGRASLTMSVPPLGPGELRRLGNLTLESGFAVRGSLYGPDGTPVAGARIWSLRHAPNGPLGAWASDRILAASSDHNGEFKLSGLAPGPVLIRIDAAQLARSYIEQTLTEKVTDAGAIQMRRGGTVLVENVDYDSAIARVDLRGDWHDSDMLTATAAGGAALIRSVPAGKYLVSVLSDMAVVCDEQITVSDEEQTRVRCGDATRVSGVVRVGNAPAPGGTLIWTRSRQPQIESVIVNHMSPLDARQQRVFGLGHGARTAPVTHDGRYELRKAGSGEWQVSWSSGSGHNSPPQQVTIPAGVSEAIVDVFIGDSLIAGVVEDDVGAPAAGARIQVIDSGLTTISAVDGSFALVGVPEGRRELRASRGLMASEPHPVIVERDRPTPPVRLRLKEANGRSVSVHVIDATGAPAVSSFVFIDLGAAVRVLTTNAAGLARMPLVPGQPAQGRIAAHHAGSWGWTTYGPCSEEDRCDVTLRLKPAGLLAVTSEEAAGAVQLVNDLGQDVAWLSARLGASYTLRPGVPLLMNGLPEGTYQFSVGDVARQVHVRAGRTTTLDIP